MKKNRLLVVALAALTVGALAACDQKPTPTPTPTPEVTIPTETGKVTFYLTLGDGSATFADYCSIWLTGCMAEENASWATGTKAYEFKKLEGDNKIYYTFAPWDATTYTGAQVNEYQVVIGYNSKSNMPESKLGLQWVDNYKSKETRDKYTGLENPTFTVVDGKADLGTQTFENALKAPSTPKTNYTVVWNFDNAVPSYCNVYMYGSWTGWATPGASDPDSTKLDAGKLKEVEGTDRKQWSYTFDTIYADTYAYLIAVEYNDVTPATFSWNKLQNDNMTYTVNDADDNDKFTWTVDVHFDPATKPDPTKTYDFVFNVTNNGTGSLAAGAKIYIAGNFNGWTAEALTEVDANNYTITENITIGPKEFGIMGNTDWSDKFVKEDTSNNVVTLQADKLIVTCAIDFALVGVEGAHVCTLTY